MFSEGIKILIVEDEGAHADAIYRSFYAVTPGVKITTIGSLKAFRLSMDTARPMSF